MLHWRIPLPPDLVYCQMCTALVLQLYKEMRGRIQEADQSTPIRHERLLAFSATTRFRSLLLFA